MDTSEPAAPVSDNSVAKTSEPKPDCLPFDIDQLRSCHTSEPALPVSDNSVAKMPEQQPNGPPIGIGKRRMCIMGDDEPPSVRPNKMAKTTPPGLMTLSDEMLLEVLVHCDGTTLESLAGTCYRLRRVVEDPRLWHRFDFSRKRLLAYQLKYRFRHLHDKTHTFHVRGRAESKPLPAFNNVTLTRRMLATLRESCPQLLDMSISHAFIDTYNGQHTIFDYPATLESFAMRHVHARFPDDTRTFFTRIDTHMANLHTIRFEYCPWFHTHNLIVFSKLEHLRHLSLRGCVTMRDCVPYGSVSTRFGFKKLHTLDLRDTPVADSDIQCFNITSTLRRLYLQAPAPASPVRTGDDADKCHCRRPMRTTHRLAADSSSSSAAAAAPAYTYTSPPETVSSSSPSASPATAATKDDSSTEPTSRPSTSPEAGLSPPTQSAPAETSTTTTAIGTSSPPEADSSTAPTAGSTTTDSSLPPKAATTSTPPPSPFVSAQATADSSSSSRSSADSSSSAPTASAPSEALLILPGPSSAPALPLLTDADDTLKESAEAKRMRQPAVSLPAGFGAGSPQRCRSCNGWLPASPMTLVPSVQFASDAFARNGNGNTNERELQLAVLGPPVPSAEADEAARLAANQRHYVGVVVRSEHVDNYVVHPYPLPNGGAHIRIPGCGQARLIVMRNVAADQHGVLPNAIGEMLHRNRLGTDCLPNRQYKPTELVTDRGICSFGESSSNLRGGLIWIRCEARPRDTQLERISLRGYRCITDTTLNHLAECAPRLQRLDVRDTGVTEAGVLAFRLGRPSCELLTSLPAEAAAAAATAAAEAGAGPSNGAKNDETTNGQAMNGDAAAAGPAANGVAGGSATTSPDHAVAGGSGTNRSHAYRIEKRDGDLEDWSDSD